MRASLPWSVVETWPLARLSPRAHVRDRTRHGRLDSPPSGQSHRRSRSEATGWLTTLVDRHALPKRPTYGRMATTTRNCIFGHVRVPYRPVDSSARHARGYCVPAEFTCSPDDQAIFPCLRAFARYGNIRAVWSQVRGGRFWWQSLERSRR